MSELFIAEWFKNTIPGIVILGAIGSLIAVGVLWVAKKLFVPLLSQSFNFAFKWLLSHFIYQATYKLTKLYLAEKNNKLLIFYIMQLMQMLMALFVATCGFIYFAVSIANASILFQASILVPLVICFLALWYAIKCMFVAFTPLFIDVDIIIENAVQQAKELKESLNSKS